MAPSLRRLSLPRIVGVALAIVLVGASVGIATAAPPPKPPPAPVVVWTPASLDLTVVRGSGTSATAAFTAAKKLPSVTLSAVGGTAPFVTVSPASFSSVAAGTPVTISLAVAVPASTVLGDYTGSVVVSSGKKAVANSLPVTVHVVAPAAHVYWANTDTGFIGRADLDGSNANASFLAAQATSGVATDAQFVYWTVSGGNNFASSIGRANLDGSNPNPNFIVIPTPASLYDVAVDANFIYWTDAVGSIGRANLDGSGVQLTFIPTPNPLGLAVDATNIYWTSENSETISRASLDGLNPDPTFMSGVGPGLGIIGVAVDATHIYWTYNIDTLDGAVGRANLDGSNPNLLLITQPSTLTGVAVDATHIYWSNLSNHFSAFPSSIGRADLDGSNPNPNFITNAGSPTFGSPFFLAVGH